MKRLSLCLWALAIALAAATSSRAFEGHYRGGMGDYRQDLMIRKHGADHDVTFNVGTPGCSGALEGVGRGDGDRLRVTPADPGEGGGRCVVYITRVGARLKVEPVDCGDFHGPSCDFEGVYRRR